MVRTQGLLLRLQLRAPRLVALVVRLATPVVQALQAVRDLADQLLTVARPALLRTVAQPAARLKVQWVQQVPRAVLVDKAVSVASETVQPVAMVAMAARLALMLAPSTCPTL